MKNQNSLRLALPLKRQYFSHTQILSARKKPGFSEAPDRRASSSTPAPH